MNTPQSYLLAPLAITLSMMALTVPVHAAEPQLEQRISRLEKLVEGQGLVDMYLRIEQLQQEVQALRGEIEVQNNTLEGIKQRQRDLYLDIDRRLRQLESGAVAPAATSPTPTDTVITGQTTNNAAAATTTPVATDPVAEEAAYRAAFKLLKEGRYAPATSRFRDFLAKYPESSYADNAQYWLGEVSYVTRAFEQAIAEFDKVLNNYPASTKHADAMLKQAYCYYELKNTSKANELLTAVITKYPQSTAARLAEKRREKIQAEGN